MKSSCSVFEESKEAFVDGCNEIMMKGTRSKVGDSTWIAQRQDFSDATDI